jgi:hypothetical protein
MPENNNNLKVLSEDWSDDLMIKDEQGNMQPLKDAVDVVSPVTSKVSPVSKPAPAPEDDKFVVAEPTGFADDKKELSFHPEDDVEIQKIAASLPSDDSKKYSLEKITDKLIAKHNLKFVAAEQSKFTDIFFDFFRNRKNAIIIRELLSKNILMNNSVLSEDVVNSLVSVAKAIKENINQEGGLVVRAKDMVAPKPATSEVLQPVEVTSSAEKPELADIEKELNQDVAETKDAQDEIKNILPTIADEKGMKEESKSDEELAITEISKELNGNKAKKDEEEEEDEVKKLAPEDIAKEIEKTPVEEKVEEPEEKINLPKVSRPTQKSSDRKQVEDVVAKETPKEVPKVVEPPKEVPPAKKPAKATLTGAVEELQSLTLDNFRRLGDSPSKQAEKLLAKINLLEKDSVTKKAQGIEAWRNSEIYTLYLKLGEESLSQNKDVAEIINQYQANDNKSLNLEEFSAISDLNKHLRF